MINPNHPEFVLHPEMALESFANVGGSCIPSKRFFKRNDEEKRWLNELRKDPDRWEKFQENERDYREMLHNNLY